MVRHPYHWSHLPWSSSGKQSLSRNGVARSFQHQRPAAFPWIRQLLQTFIHAYSTVAAPSLLCADSG
ncbi:hypothetical protein QTP70_034292 [Hemibagrus guttatus]|uniref:Uncharacterized protein n=1 Tax=Hemibagrus guttatus TaxID=175788 RepID=A0AAE0V7Z1_9TELE|nr:hypothetical protein QTP70_034292 [Hemibagrus guttatus]